MSYRVVSTMCIQKPSIRVLATLILTAGLALCDTACASTKRSTGLASTTTGLPSSLRRNPPGTGTSRSRGDATTRTGVAPSGSGSIQTTNTSPATNATGPLDSASTPRETLTTSVSTSGQSPSTTVVTTTTQTPIATEVEDTSRLLWPFLTGLAIAAAIGLIVLFRPTVLRSR